MFCGCSLWAIMFEYEFMQSARSSLPGMSGRHSRDAVRRDAPALQRPTARAGSDSEATAAVRQRRGQEVMSPRLVVARRSTGAGNVPGRARPGPDPAPAG